MLKDWPLRFGTADGKQKAHIPFNSKLDTLYFKYGEEFHDLATRTTAQDRDAIEKVAANISYWDAPFFADGVIDYDWGNRVIEILQNDFPNLEYLYWPNEFTHPQLWDDEGTTTYLYEDFFELQHPDDAMPYLMSLEDCDKSEFNLGIDDAVEENLIRWVVEGEGRFDEVPPPDRNFAIETVRLPADLIGLQVDSWGYLLENPLSGDELQRAVREIHSTRDAERKEASRRYAQLEQIEDVTADR